MTGIKLCGLSRPQDIETVNKLKPDYVGFVFAPKSRRYVPPEKARELKSLLSPEIKAVGVFVDETPEKVAELLDAGVIDLAQLHGKENEDYLQKLRTLTGKPVIQAFLIRTEEDVQKAQNSSADYILLDSGAGSGTLLDWNLAARLQRPYFLAGGLTPHNVRAAVRTLHPFAVDVSSGIETNGQKDKEKMAAFTAAVRKEDRT